MYVYIHTHIYILHTHIYNENKNDVMYFMYIKTMFYLMKHEWLIPLDKYRNFT